MRKRKKIQKMLWALVDLHMKNTFGFTLILQKVLAKSAGFYAICRLSFIFIAQCRNSYLPHGCINFTPNLRLDLLFMYKVRFSVAAQDFTKSEFQKYDF